METMESSDTLDYASLPPTAESLRLILARLRAPGGCPWDREQTAVTLSRCLVDECAELLDALDDGDMPHVCEELGDVLMNVIFQVVVAEEQRAFTLEDVVSAINQKMIRRHPHVFGDSDASTSEAVLKQWEKIKADEPGRDRHASLLDRVPRSLSSLNRAEGLQVRAAKVGFDWTGEQGIIDKIEEELAEVKSAMAQNDQAAVDEELGDLLFAVSNLTRFRKRATAEELLRQANEKFSRRFRHIEQRAAEEGCELKNVSIQKMEQWWNEAKEMGK